MHFIYNKIRVRKKDSIVLFTIGIIFCVLIAFFKESIFPEKYFFDSLTLQYGVDHPIKETLDQSFSNTAYFYRIFHIDKNFAAPILALLVYFFVIFKLFKNYSVNYISFFSYALIIVYSAIAMVYLATYSKDLVLFLIVVLPFVYLEKKSLLIWSLFVVFYAFYFRNYWFIIIALFWGFKFFITQKPRLLLLAIPVYYILISFMYNYIFGTPLSMIRYLTNLDRDAESAQTAIAIFIDGNNFLMEATNYFVTLIFLIVPIPLLLLGKPFYVILTLLIMVFFYNFIKTYLKEYSNKDYTNIFSFVISFMLVQSLFEPDYGSFVRHLAPLYPLIFVCIVKNVKNLEIEE